MTTGIDSFERWQNNLKRVWLAHWQDLPKLALYIDQLADYVNETLAALNVEPLTKAMINNYVKKNVIVAPVHKKYGTSQVADLVIIGLMKSCFNLNDIKAGVAQITIHTYPQRAYNRFVDLFNSRIAGKKAADDAEIDPASDKLMRLTVDTLVNRLVAARLLKCMQAEEQPKKVE